ncbi:MAG: hypothetical protein AAGA77_03655 [Bacteroidota bacterium]
MALNLLPYLSPSSTSKNTYKIDMCYLEDPNFNPPSITFVEEDKTQIKDPEPLGMTGSELVKISLNNLKELNLSLETIDEGNAKVLALTNTEFASEKILDKEFLIQAAKNLNTTKIKVAIPVRDSIIICNADDDDALKILNTQLHKLYNDFSRETLTNLIFEIENGIIQSAETINVTSTVDDQLQQALGSYQEKKTKAKLFQDLFNIRLVVEAESIGDLQNGLFYSLLEVISENKSNRNFNNSIEIILGDDTIKKNEENVQKIHYLLDRVGEKVRAQNIQLKEPIKTSFIFTVDFRNGDNHKKIIKLIK